MKTPGITEKNGLLYIRGVACLRDAGHRFYSDLSAGSTEWVCPHCLLYLTVENEELFCQSGCHLRKGPDKASVFIPMKGKERSERINAFFESVKKRSAQQSKEAVAMSGMMIYESVSNI